jgi:hypothetical protein
MEAVLSCKTLAEFYRTTRRHIPENSTLDTHRCENLNSNGSFVLATSSLRPTTTIFIFQLNNCGYSPYVTSSDKRTGLSFTIAASPRQLSHSRVRVPWDSLPYFTVSDSRLRFLSPPATRRATVEVFDPSLHVGCHSMDLQRSLLTRDNTDYQLKYLNTEVNIKRHVSLFRN